LVEDFDLDLPNVGVPGERKLDAELGCAIERIRIVVKKNVGNVAADERLQAGKSLLPLAARRPFALIINAHEVESSALESKLGIFLAQQLHAGLGVERSGFVFRTCVDFVIAIAAPDAERSAQMANFVDAIGDGITHSGNEVTSDNSKVCAEFIGHIHGAAYLSAGHVATEVNVADLHDFHAIESGRQVGHGNFDAAHLIVKALGREAVHRSEKRSGTSGGRSGTEKETGGWINNGRKRSRGGILSSVRCH